MSEKIWFDTDIGSDIDDAVCLAYLLANQACELLGISTVTGEPIERAKLASALCRRAGRDIPIFPGAPTPLLVEQRQKSAAQAQALGHWEHEERFPAGQAVESMRRAIRRYPHEVTLLAVGPFTNVALLFAADPEIPALLKQLVVMGGSFYRQSPYYLDTEWNALVDPHATAMMYAAHAAGHKSVGLDVTRRVTMEAAEVRARFSEIGLLAPVLDFAEVWFAGSGVLTFHDPLAGVSIFEPDVARFERGRVEVELQSDRLRGMTFWQAEPDGPHEAACDCDPALFFDRYFSIFS